MNLNPKSVFETALSLHLLPFYLCCFIFVEVILTANQALVPNNCVGSQTWRMYRAVNKPTNANRIQASVIRVPVLRRRKEKSFFNNKELNNFIGILPRQRKLDLICCFAVKKLKNKTRLRRVNVDGFFLTVGPFSVLSSQLIPVVNTPTPVFMVTIDRNTELLKSF